MSGPYLMDQTSCDFYSKVRFKHLEAKKNIIHGSFIEWIVFQNIFDVFEMV